MSSSNKTALATLARRAYFTLFAGCLSLGGCLAYGPVPDGMYYVAGWKTLPEFRPADREHYMYGMFFGDGVMISPEFHPMAIQLRLWNLHKEPVTVDWNRSALLIGSQTHTPVVVTPDIDCANPIRPDRPSSIVPSGSTLSVWIVPADHLRRWEFIEDNHPPHFPPSYPPAYKLQEMLNPQLEILDYDYCELRDFFPMSAEAREEPVLQVAESQGWVGKKVGLYIEWASATTRWSKTLTFEVARVMPPAEWVNLSDRKVEGRRRHLEWLMIERTPEDVNQAMKLGEYGYELR